MTIWSTSIVRQLSMPMRHYGSALNTVNMPRELSFAISFPSMNWFALSYHRLSFFPNHVIYIQFYVDVCVVGLSVSNKQLLPDQL